MNIIHGDITKTDKDIIVQQVNCQARMGSGLARAIMSRYDSIRKEYIAFCKKNTFNGKTDSLLGKVHYFDTYDGKIVANVFGQDDIVKSRQDATVYTVEEALLEGIQKVKDLAEKSGFSVAIPVGIGCGLANGDWKVIGPKIEKIFEDGKVKADFYKL